MNGPINLCSDGVISMSWLHNELQKSINDNIYTPCYDKLYSKHPYSVHTEWEKNKDLFFLSTHSDWIISNEYAKSLGLTFSNTELWIKSLINNLATIFKNNVHKI